MLTNRLPQESMLPCYHRLVVVGCFKMRPRCQSAVSAMVERLEVMVGEIGDEDSPKNGVEWSHKTANFISILFVYYTNVYVYIYIDSRSTYYIHNISSILCTYLYRYILLIPSQMRRGALIFTTVNVDGNQKTGDPGNHFNFDGFDPL